MDAWLILVLVAEERWNYEHCVSTAFLVASVSVTAYWLKPWKLPSFNTDLYCYMGQCELAWNSNTARKWNLISFISFIEKFCIKELNQYACQHRELKST